MDQATSASGGRGERSMDFESRLQLLLGSLGLPRPHRPLAVHSGPLRGRRAPRARVPRVGVSATPARQHAHALALASTKHRDHSMKLSKGMNKYLRMKHRQHGMKSGIRYEKTPTYETDDHGLKQSVSYGTDTHGYEITTKV